MTTPTMVLQIMATLAMAVPLEAIDEAEQQPEIDSNKQGWRGTKSR